MDISKAFDSVSYNKLSGHLVSPNPCGYDLNHIIQDNISVSVLIIYQSYYQYYQESLKVVFQDLCSLLFIQPLHDDLPNSINILIFQMIPNVINIFLIPLTLIFFNKVQISLSQCSINNQLSCNSVKCILLKFKSRSNQHDILPLIIIILYHF